MSAATAPHVRRIKPTTRLPWAFVVVLGLATLAVVVLLGFIFFQIVYAFHVLPNVSVWNVDLSHQSLDEATAHLETQLAVKFNNTTIELTDGEQQWYATPLDLGLRLDAHATAQAALDVARGNAGEQFNAALGGINLPPNVVFDPGAARSFLARLAQQIDRAPIDAGLQLNELTVITTPSQIGRVLDVTRTLSMLAETAPSFDKPTRLNLPIETLQPTVRDTSAAAARLQSVLQGNLTLDLDNPLPGEPASWDLTPQQLASLITTQLSPDGTDITIEFNPDLLHAGLADLAAQIDRTPEDARFTFNDDTHQLDVISPSKVGRTLNITSTIERMNAALASGERRVKLDVVCATTRYSRYGDGGRSGDHAAHRHRDNLLRRVQQRTHDQHRRGFGALSGCDRQAGRDIFFRQVPGRCKPGHRLCRSVDHLQRPHRAGRGRRRVPGIHDGLPRGLRRRLPHHRTLAARLSRRLLRERLWPRP